MAYGQFSHDQSPGTPAVQPGSGRGRERRVFTDSGEVFHRWAHQVQSEARYRDNVSFRNRTLFSYQTAIGFVMPDGVALCDNERFSVTTSGHQSAMRYAVNHMRTLSVPGLDLLCSTYGDGTLDFLAAYDARTIKREAARDISDESDAVARRFACRATNHVNAIRSYIAKAATSAPRETLDYLGSRIGMTAKQVGTIIAEREREAAKRKAAQAKAQTVADIRAGKAYAAMPDSDFIASFPRDGNRQWSDGSKPWELRELESFGRKLASYHKALPVGKTRDAMWRKVKLFREHLSGRNDRIAVAYRHELAKGLQAWRRDSSIPLNGHLFKPSTQAIVERGKRAAFVASKAGEVAGWIERREGKRPPANFAASGSPEESYILADIARERNEWESAYLAWLAGGADVATIPDKPDSVSLYDYRLTGDAAGMDYKPNAQALYESAQPLAFASYHYAKAKAELDRRERERKEAERKERESRELAAWRDGTGSRHASYSDERGGALLRIVGNRLETSHGVSVPLEDAIRAFRFVKLIRERGKGWKRNGAQVFVGGYPLDSIMANGDFIAGCHRINWPEVERAAIAAGVFDQSADDSAVQGSKDHA